MSAENPRKIRVTSVLFSTFGMLRKNPKVLLPFALVCLVELFILALLYLSPRQPFLPVLGPPIRTFFGEQYLHFPLNFLLLPKIVSNGKIIMAILLGSFSTCMAVHMVYELVQDKRAKISLAAKVALKKYLSAFCVVLLVYALYFLLTKLFAWGLAKYFSHFRRLFFLGPRPWFGMGMAVVNILAGVGTQLVFIFSIPLLVIKEKKLFPALGGSIILLKRLFFPALLLILLPLLAYLPLLVLDYNTVFLMDKFFPEIVLILLTVSTVFTTMVLDPLITCSTTLLYLMDEKVA